MADWVIITGMTSVSAVVTTGIYCRPGCGANPQPRNLLRFPSAAAAEAAGYRACLRCRPYRLHPAASWTGPEVVCRAVQLILDGALDGKTEHDLARRMFISARHLRRLFQEHLGATPDQVARSARTHFARRLLDDTDLTVVDIAFASGFGSLRQLDRACRAVFRAAPRELRARRRAADRLVADGGLALRMPFRPPLDWAAMLGYFEAQAIPGVECVSDGTYRRTVAIDGDPGVIELSSGGPDHLLLTAHLPHWEGLIHLVQRARRIFALDADLEGAVLGLEGDLIMGPLLRARPGIRPPGAWDPFETGVRVIVEQQVGRRGASTIVSRIVDRYGTAVPGVWALGLTHLFPTPPTLATADLTSIGLTASRAAAVNAFAVAVADGAIRFDRGSTLDQFTESVTALEGLGPWTAQHLALRLGEPDALPAADLRLRRRLSDDAGHPLSRRAAEALAERWRPWRAHAAAHLWLGGRSSRVGEGRSR